MTVDWKICSDCETIECVDSCAAGALKQCVRFLSVDELMKILMRDFPNRGSDGGVTFSDGEPLLHHEFLDRCCSVAEKKRCIRQLDYMRSIFFVSIEWARPNGSSVERNMNTVIMGICQKNVCWNCRNDILIMILPAILERILRSKFIIYTVLKISLRCLAKEFFIDPAYIAIFIEVHTMKKSLLRIN